MGILRWRPILRTRRVRCLWCWPMDLGIVHNRFGSNSDLNLNGHLHYPNDIDRSVNEDTGDKIRKYRSDYNNNPLNSTSFMTVITNTSGRLHSEFVWLLFLQDHRETDRFFEASGVQLVHSPWWDTYHFKNTYSPITLASFSSINLVFIFKCSSSPINTVYVRSVDSSSWGIPANSSVWVLKYRILCDVWGHPLLETEDLSSPSSGQSPQR